MFALYHVNEIGLGGLIGEEAVIKCFFDMRILANISEP